MFVIDKSRVVYKNACKLCMQASLIPPCGAHEKGDAKSSDGNSMHLACGECAAVLHSSDHRARAAS